MTNGEGDGRTGPIGVKQIADYLNKRGYKSNTGGPFYTGTVHAILTRPAYSGTHYFNRMCSRTRKQKPREEWVPFETPVIIPTETFDVVQHRLKARSPEKTAPRVVNSPVLLTGLARCQNCNGSLMLTTGKSGRYRYYSCASKALKGSCGCGRPIRIPEAKLDTVVTDALIERLFTRDRLKALLAETLKKTQDNNQDALHDLRGLRRELREADKKIERLYEALTDGIVTDTRGFRDHRSRLENQREELMRLISIKERRLNMDTRHLTNRQIDRFANGLRDLLKDGPKPFRKEYLRLLVSQVNVGDDEIMISGSKAALAAAVQAQKANKGQVPGYVREWRTRQDSNL